jgi:molecular chaperone DnaJ
VIRTQWSFTPTVKTVQRGPCPGCSGNRLQPPGICLSCAGNGLVWSERSILVNVPAGVEDVNVLRLRDEGGVGKYGGKAGDLYVRFQVHKDDSLQRVGADLHSKLSLHLFDALLGCHISVDTPRGERMLEIPEGTQHGDQLALRSAGVATTLGGTVERGHHYFNVHVVIPNGDHMLEDQRQLLRQCSYYS